MVKNSMERICTSISMFSHVAEKKANAYTYELCLLFKLSVTVVTITVGILQ